MDTRKVDRLTKGGKVYFILKCLDCGRISKPIRSDRVKTFKCNCDYKPTTIGDVFGSLTVIRKIGQVKSSKHARARLKFLVECTCGNEVNVREDHIRSGNTKTCGKCPTVLTENKFLSNRASNILQRCNNPYNNSYMSYGGIGIKCLLGETITEVVISLLKIPGYVDGYEIDRIDPFKDYTIIHEEFKSNIWYSDDYPEYQCLGNLRWVPRNVNIVNKRKIKELKYIYGAMYKSKNNYLPLLVKDYMENYSMDNLDKLSKFINKRDLEETFSKHFLSKFKKEFKVQRLSLKWE